MDKASIKTELKVADEVWIVTALLHREHPQSPDFPIQQIMERARQERLHKPLRAGLYVHVVQHCVANRPPNPARYRVLLETRPGRRRLFRLGDVYHPQREGAKIVPKAEDLPYGYNGLLNWYRDWCENAASSTVKTDALLALRGSGKHLWSDEHADDYVRRLRQGWE